MNERKPVEIRCTACGKEALLLREARYEGFQRVGETLRCAACGYEYPGEDAVPFRAHGQAPAVFTEEDRAETPELFAEGEAGQLCRYCRHYVVNPFRQWCGKHRREVEATDTCPQFTPPEVKKDPFGDV